MFSSFLFETIVIASYIVYCLSSSSLVSSLYTTISTKLPSLAPIVSKMYVKLHSTADQLLHKLEPPLLQIWAQTVPSYIPLPQELCLINALNTKHHSLFIQCFSTQYPNTLFPLPETVLRYLCLLYFLLHSLESSVNSMRRSTLGNFIFCCSYTSTDIFLIAIVMWVVLFN